MSQDITVPIDPIKSAIKSTRTYEIVISALRTPAGTSYNIQFDRETVDITTHQSGLVEVDREGDQRVFTPTIQQALAFTYGGITGPQVLAFLQAFGDSLEPAPSA